MSSNWHREARLSGYAKEKELAIALTRSYPGEHFRLGFKETFDIYNRCVLIDNVSMDKQGRIIIDKKHGAIAHRREAQRLNKRGYISFLLDDVYYFLSISSDYVTHHIRPKVTPMLLRSCCTDVMSPSNKSKLIISERYRKDAIQASCLKQQQEYLKYAIKTPVKEPHISQEQRIKKQWDDAVSKYGYGW